MSATLAQPCGECCFRSPRIAHSGTPRGAFEVIGGVSTYVVRPALESEGVQDAEVPRKVILFFSDVFGVTYVNSKLAMDYWADNGFLVLGVDYFQGDSCDNYRDQVGWDKVAWVSGMRKSAAPLVPPWLAAVRELYEKPGTRFFTVGYCFGAPYVMQLLASDWVTAGGFAHPAFLDEDHFHNVKKPLLLSCPEDDFTFPLDARRKAEEILISHSATYFFQVFSGATHGFATRPDPELKAERWAKEESARSMMNWFNHHAEA